MESDIKNEPLHVTQIDASTIPKVYTNKGEVYHRNKLNRMTETMYQEYHY